MKRKGLMAGLALVPTTTWTIQKFRAEQVANAPAEATIVKLAYRPMVKWAAKQVLLGRYIDRNEPTRGRFTREQMNRVLTQTWKKYDELAPGAHVAQYRTHGARQNALLSVLVLAIYRTLLAEGTQDKYATELVSDLGWKIYAKWIVLPRLIARLAKNDPQGQVNLMLRMFLRFPFNRPGYDWKAWTDDSGAYAIDFYRCPMRDFMKSQGEEEFMRNSLCTWDFALAQVMTDGGSYQRPHTLSAGDRVCDMKWYAGKPGTGDGPSKANDRPTRRSPETVEHLRPSDGKDD